MTAPAQDAPHRASLIFPLVLLVGGASIYGSIFAANKIVAEAGVPPMAYVFWQSVGGGLILFVLSALTRQLPPVSYRHLRQYAVTSTLGVVIPVIVLAIVAAKLQAGVVTLLITLTPAITYLYAMLFRVERFRWLGIGGVVFGLGGVALIVLPEGSLTAAGDAGWVLLLLIVPFCFATNNIFVALVSPPRTSSLMLACGLVLAAALISLVVMLIGEGFYGFWEAPASGSWGILWASGVNAVTFFCMFEIIRRTGPVFFAQYNYVIVIAGLIWSLVLFDENLSAWIWIAFAVMLVGLGLANEAARRGVREREALADTPAG
ncbi:MAG TPA: DMT family transporter [Alphaproteobacteria bacterium]|nr:DMT family transporter [Alphaproteobacteria bacterium]